MTHAKSDVAVVYVSFSQKKTRTAHYHIISTLPGIELLVPQ